MDLSSRLCAHQGVHTPSPTSGLFLVYVKKVRIKHSLEIHQLKNHHLMAFANLAATSARLMEAPQEVLLTWEIFTLVHRF